MHTYVLNKAVGTTTAVTVLAIPVFSLKKLSRELHNICRKPSMLFMRFNPFYEMAGGLPRFEDILDLPANPHQPHLTAFPKRLFGKAILVYRSFQASWFKEFPFLHYDEAKDVAFCHTCTTAIRQKKIRTGSVDGSFISCIGYIATYSC